MQNLVALVVQTANGVILDDHNNSHKPIDRVTHLGEYHGEVVALLQGTTFCLNPVYFNPEDGKIHLSTWSVGGNIYARSGLLEAIEKYNDSVEKKDRITDVQPLVKS